MTWEGEIDAAFCDAFSQTGSLLALDLSEDGLCRVRPKDLAVLDELLGHMVEFQSQRLVALLEERETLKDRIAAGKELAAEHIKQQMRERHAAPAPASSWW